jgi:hypothetical protein
MRLMIVVFVFVTLLIVDFGRFGGYYTGEAGDLVQHYIGKFIR